MSPERLVLERLAPYHDVRWPQVAAPGAQQLRQQEVAQENTAVTVGERDPRRTQDLSAALSDVESGLVIRNSGARRALDLLRATYNDHG